MANVFAGYKGLASIAGIGNVRFSDASITARQEINAPDLIMGDWDHDAYVFGPIEVGGSISGPITETFVCGSGGGSGLWAWGVTRDSTTCGSLSSETVDLWYYCDSAGINHREFTGMYVNSLNVSCAAGDVAQFSIDVLGSSATDLDHEDAPEFTDAEKLITWDKVAVSITPGPNPEFTPPANVAYSNFDFTISNNLETVYALNQANLFPFEIVPGLRTITGSISVYNSPNASGKDSWGDYLAADVGTIQFSLGGGTGSSCDALTIDMKVRFHRVEPASTVGPIISSIGFTGVTHQTGSAWES